MGSLRLTRRTDWQAWHAPYAREDSALTRRLRLVQRRVGEWLDAHPDGPVRVVSACAGRGADIIEVLACRDDAARVSAVLIELDPGNAAWAEQAAVRSRLEQVEVRRADAGDIASYRGAVPADLLLFCGVFGNVSDADVRTTVSALPHLASPGASVIWTRSRRSPDLTPAVRRWFAESGFREQHFDAPPDALFSVGVHRLSTDRPVTSPPPRQLFRFLS